MNYLLSCLGMVFVVSLVQSDNGLVTIEVVDHPRVAIVFEGERAV